MPTFQIKATELTDTDVSFVSLVKRGANRIPFRITKGDQDMIDLHKIGRSLFRKADTAPAVVGVVARKGADLKAIRAVMKAADIPYGNFVKKSDGAEGTVSYKAAGDHEGVMLLKMNDDFALVVSNLKKAFQGYDFDSKDFKSVHATNSFASSVSAAFDSLRNTIANIMDGSKDPKGASSEIESAIDEFKDHVSTLVSGLPEKAMKADAALLKASKPQDDGDEQDADDQDDDDNDGGGTDDDQETGDDQGDNANGGKKTTMKSSDGKELDDEGDPGAKDPLMPAKKDDAGKNGTGAGAEMGKGTETNPRATADDEQNTEVNAKPGGKTSGTDTGLPAKAKAPTKKAAGCEQDDDDSSNGAQGDIPAKAKAKTKKSTWHGQGGNDAEKPPKGSTTRNSFDADCDGDGDDDTVMTGESAAGEGAAEPPADSEAANARGTADDQRGSKNTGRPGAATLDMNGVPAKAKAPTTKTEAERNVGKKGKNPVQEEEESISGAGAQEKDVQTYKSDDPVMKAISALAKSMEKGFATVNDKVAKIDQRVDGVASMAKKTDAALNGTVFGDAANDEPARTQKSDRGSAPPLLDTAYARRTA